MLILIALPLIIILALALLFATAGAALSATSTIIAQLSGLIYAALALLAGIAIGFIASEYRHIRRTLDTRQPAAQRIEAAQPAALPVTTPLQYTTPAMLRPVVSDVAGDWWGGDDE